jgi:hypothetical protein
MKTQVPKQTMKLLLFFTRFITSTGLAIFLALPSSAQEITKGQKKAMRWGNQSEYHSMSQEGGPYLIFNFGIRRDGKPTIPNHDFSNLSGNLGLGLGYRKGNFSFEYGLNFLYYSPETITYIPLVDRLLYLNSYANSLIIPLVFRYDIPVREKERFRFGANFTTNYIIAALTDGLPFGYRGAGGSNPNAEPLKYTWVTSDKQSRFFFKAGLHAEFQFLNSSFLILQASRAFTISPNRNFLVSWQADGQNGNFEVESRIQGYMIELNYKIPLNVLGKKLFGKG